jgi:glutamate carboxypeptidase
MVKGSFTGSGTKKLMLIAHMDTVYPAGTLANEPYRQDGNKLYGPGIADDKGGIAVVLHSLAILKDAGWRDYAQLTVLFNHDEEIGSGTSGETIAQLADQHDYVFSCEPTAAKAIARNEGLLLGAAGAARATMEVKGRSAHAGVAPDAGPQRADRARVPAAADARHRQGHPGSAAQLDDGQGRRRQQPDSGPGERRADVRITAPGAAERLRAALQEKVKAGRLVPDTETTVTVDVGHSPYIANDRARALARQAQSIYAELDGRELMLHPMTGGVTDAGFAGRSGKAVVLESFGLAGWGYHAREEYIEIDSIVPRLYLMTRLLQTVARAP